MANLTQKDVLRVAKLAKITLTDAELEKFTGQLSEVVNFVRELDKVETGNINATSQTTGLVNVRREDAIDPLSQLSSNEAVSQSPKAHNGYFVVPYVLKAKPA